MKQLVRKEKTGMRFKDKVSRVALRVSLIAMVVLSIILSAVIWGSDARFSRIEETSNQTQTKDLGQRSLRDIYLPTQTFYFKNKKMYQVYDTKNNLPLEFSKLTQSLRPLLPIRIWSSQTKYEKMLRNPNYIQLTYPDQITISLFLTNVRKNDSREFNRIFVSTTSSDYIYLGNDENHTLYCIRLNDVSFKTLIEHIRNAQTQMPVTLEKVHDDYLPFYEKNLSLPVYSYLTNEESDSYFVYRLLGSNNPTQHSNGDTITYSNGVYERLIAAKHTHNYEYIDYQQDQIPKTISRKLNDSLYFVRKIGLSEPDLRFFDADDNTVIYQNYVEEYPIFLPGKYKMRAQVKFASNGMTINFNSLDLQIPIPTNGEKKTLIPTTVAMDELYQKGYYRKDIERIIIGYTAKSSNSKNKKLVDLEPAYYVKINKQWKTLDEWLNTNNQLDNAGKEGLVDGL
jgi:regulatory protein YycH of two-component signal transduction system YycFG